MDKHTYENWKKIKDALEESGKTDSFFYKRACAIVKAPADSAKDPFDPVSDL